MPAVAIRLHEHNESIMMGNRSFVKATTRVLCSGLATLPCHFFRTGALLVDSLESGTTGLNPAIIPQVPSRRQLDAKC